MHSEWSVGGDWGGGLCVYCDLCCWYRDIPNGSDAANIAKAFAKHVCFTKWKALMYVIPPDAAVRDAVLREAAAKIRAEVGVCCVGHPQPEYGCGTTEGMREAADLIDPDVNTDE